MKKHHRRTARITNLEKYAFWLGFASTLISLCQVIILASR